MIRHFKVEKAGNNGWSRWVQPVAKNYLMACCDCNLVHHMDFRIVKGRIQFRAKRAPRYTKQQRRIK